ncbi:MAG TPA: PAS domain S-box protein [Gemmatimonadaceae bacterium]|nr:PAS domain S-box protein [Gemmatimonadaceae bacterium]
MLAVALPVALSVVRHVISVKFPSAEAGESLFLVPVVLVAFAGGLRPGLLATAISGGLASYAVLVPQHVRQRTSPLESTELVAVIAMGVVIAVLFEGLRRSRDRARRAQRHSSVILRSITDGVLTTDLAGHVTYLNPVAECLTGATRAAVVGRPVDEVLRLSRHADRAPIVLPPTQVADFGQPFELGRALLAAHDGREIPVAGVAAPIIAYDGQFLGTVIAFRDATRELRAEEAVAERLRMREELARVVQTAPGMLYSFRLAPDGTMTLPYASPGVSHICRISPELLATTAEPLFTLLPADDVSRVREGIAESARTMQPWHDEFRVLQPDGSYIWVEGRSMPVYEPGGAITWHGYMNDVTDRKRVEQERADAVAALERSERRHRDLVEMSPDAIFVARGLRIEFANPAAVEMLRVRSVDDIVGHSAEEFARPDEVPALRTTDARLHEGATVPPGLWHMRRSDGTEGEVEVVARAFRDADGPATQVMMRDLSERRQLEAQVRESQKLESIGLLAGGVAHDFNNWLTVIAANGDILRGLVGADPDALSLVDEIRNAGDRAAALTRQLLAFSRRHVLATRVLDVNTCVADTEKMLRRLVGEDVEVNVRLHATRHVTADPGHVTQVLMNLAVNARDAMSGGGVLSISTSDVEITRDDAARFPAARRGPYVAVRVTDTGTGMPPEVVERIFEPFFTTKGVGQGTGLGLSVVHGIVRQSGGDITVTSAPGAGSTFEIILPATNAPVAAGTSAVAPPSLRGSESILLVEDELLVRRSAARALAAAGYTVREAASGEAAARLAGDPGMTIDLLVTDVVMPGIGGAVLADWVRATRPGLKVLYTSGYTDDAILRHGVQQQEVAFLAKPYDVRALLTKVRETIDAPRPHLHRREGRATDGADAVAAVAS